MTRKEFEVLARNALEGLPGEFKDRLQNVDVVIEEKSKGRLLGFYRGVPLKNRAHYYGMVMPDKIVLILSPWNLWYN